MEEKNIKNNLYQCKECGLHYKDKETADKCEAWCREHKTCNVKITRQAEENSPSHKATEEQGKTHQRGPTSLVNGVEECNKKCQEYLNNWRRAQADFENYKKE